MAGYWFERVRDGVVIAREWRDDSPEVEKRRYTFPRFIRELTDDEFSTIETIATANTAQGKRARRVLAIWKAEGVDMGDPLTLNAVTAVLGEARAQELS